MARHEVQHADAPTKADREQVSARCSLDGDQGWTAVLELRVESIEQRVDSLHVTWATRLVEPRHDEGLASGEELVVSIWSNDPKHDTGG